MIINSEKQDETLIISPNGKIDTITAPEFYEALMAGIDTTESLVIDFINVPYITSAGLRAVLAAAKRIDGRGKMKIINVCEEVAEILDMTGLTDILTIERTE